MHEIRAGAPPEGVSSSGLKSSARRTFYGCYAAQTTVTMGKTAATVGERVYSGRTSVTMAKAATRVDEWLQSSA